MTDFYIKLNSEADMPTVLAAFYKQDYSIVMDEETGEEITQLEGEPYFVPNTTGYAIDVVGTIHKATGVTLTDDEGMEYAEMAAIDGWHVNIRLSGDEWLERAELVNADHGVTPNSPSRVWL